MINYIEFVIPAKRSASRDRGAPGTGMASIVCLSSW